MPQIAKSKMMLAIIGIVFLLLSPAGVCSGKNVVQHPAHPCCPNPPPAQQHGGTNSCCVYTARLPVTPALASLDNQKQFVESVELGTPHSVEGPGTAPVSSAAIVSLPQQRFITYHQLLL
jgi:hypothetical protein